MTLKTTLTRSAFLGRSLVVALLAAWIALPTAPALAGETPGSGGREGGKNDGDGDGVEDEVGSLPMRGGGGDGSGQAPGFQGADSSTLCHGPVLVLVGRVDDLRGLVADAYGAGYVVVEPLTPDTQRWIFHGQPTVVFDRDGLARGRVEIGVRLHRRFGPGVATMAWGAHGEAQTAPQCLPAQGDLAFPVGVLTASGVLDDRAASLRVRTARGAGANFDLHASDHSIAIVQSRP